MCALLSFPIQYAVAQDINVAPLRWDFGEVTLGESEMVTFSITGAGASVESIVLGIEIIDDPTFAFSITVLSLPDFYASDNPPTYVPWFLPPGEPGYFDVTFTPPSSGFFSATLSIESTDERNPVLDIPLRGVGAPVPEPTTMLLFASGLVGLVGLGKKVRKR